jgi:hypothetical protein
MQDGANVPAAVPVDEPGQTEKVTDPRPAGANVPLALPAPPPEKTSPAVGKRGLLLLGLGVGVGLALGIVLTVSVHTTYTLVTQTVPETREQLQVFNELNELRQQINQLNEDKKGKDQAAEEAMRQALNAVASTVHPPESAKPPNEDKKGKDLDKEDAIRQALSAVTSTLPTPDSAAPGAAPPAMKRTDPFADIDEEIERLERTQKVLNTILDIFTKKNKERPKDQ